jgi:FHA domain
MGDVDWAEQALVSRVDQWIAEHPFLFMVSLAKLVRPQRAASTATALPVIRLRDTLLGTPGREPTQELGREVTGSFRLVDSKNSAPKERGTRPLVLPLRKLQPTFPSMITVGRTDTNDLIVPDEQVSKFHAFFRLVGDRVELSDAGSRNGTFVGGRRLAPRGGGAVLHLRDKFAFGAIEFQLFDACGCWEWLRQLDRFGT